MGLVCPKEDADCHVQMVFGKELAMVQDESGGQGVDAVRIKGLLEKKTNTGCWPTFEGAVITLFHLLFTWDDKSRSRLGRPLA